MAEDKTTTSASPAEPGADVCGDHPEDIPARREDVTSRLVEDMYAATNQAELRSAVSKAEEHYATASQREEAFERVLWTQQARLVDPTPHGVCFSIAT